MAFNDGYAYRALLGPEAETSSLLDYLSARYPHSDRETWAARIGAGLVLVDGAPATVDALLRRGQVVIWNRPAWDEPAAPLAFDVLYEDDDLLAVAKPAGLPTLPGAGFLHASLLQQVRAYAPDARPLHRLGRWTSGIVLFALHRAVADELTRQWAGRQIGKRYRALATGHPGERSFVVTTPIARVPYDALGSIHAAATNGKSAVSRVVVLEQRRGDFVCDVFIDTGRPHQIRIHLAAAGFPLSGDPLYPIGGVPPQQGKALPGDPGYWLHAAELRLRHPRDGRALTINCAPPPTLRTGEPASRDPEEGLRDQFTCT